MRKAISLFRRSAQTSARTIWPMMTSCCWTMAKRYHWSERVRERICVDVITDKPFLPSGVHVGGLPDQPGGDQTQSQSLPGQCVFAVVVRHTAEFCCCTPVSTSYLSSTGLHPAHALKRRRTPQKTAAGPKGKWAPLLHTMLPRLGCFQNSSLLNQLARKKMLMCLPPCYSRQRRWRCRPNMLNPSCDLTPTPPSPNLQKQKWHEFLSH